MIAIAKQNRSCKSVPAWHHRFLQMMPLIATYARLNFRHLRAESREEAVQCVIASSFVAYARLVELNKESLAYASVLSRLGCAQYRDHRRVGTRLNVNDITSSYCQARKNVVVQRLDKYDSEEDAWEEIVVQDRHVGPDQVVATKLDFADWLRRLPRRNRRIAQFLALGNRTGEAARKFKVSEGRISQVRRELQKAWAEFTGESQTPHAAVPA